MLMEIGTEKVSVAADLLLLAQCQHPDPHRFLGPHDTKNGGILRLWRPGATEMQVEINGCLEKMTLTDAAGLFTLKTAKRLEPSEYRIFHVSGLLAPDPYAFSSCLGDVDLFLFNKGCHYELYRILGCHLICHQKTNGAQFAVWAPDALGVSLVADVNHWDGRSLPMRARGSSGIWEIFVPGVQEGEKYKFEIRTKEGRTRLKSDPVAFFNEVRPCNASVAFAVDRFSWNDAVWMQKRGQASLNRPLCTYELHLGTWRKVEGKSLNYRQLGIELAAYCKEMGFTHVEFMPILEHPLDESWGYQVSGFFAVTSRFGTPADFQFLVDHLHQNGIGVFLDWVPAHFPSDDHALSRFDGTALYEHEDPRRGVHPHWHTSIFNYSRKEVANFLIASALFWLEVMHIDGLRVDAVSSMLYLDYGRKAGEWIPNPDGSQYDFAAIEFLKHLNSIVRTRVPGALMIAEESSAFLGVTHPLEAGGLGFHLKWNMGWMNDTLRYFTTDPFFRKYHQNELTFSLVYAFSEKFQLALSHDEVVHEKRSLLAKMPGPDWQKFAGLRLLYSYMMGHPGKKLFFMGGEIAQWNEWDCKGSLDWNLLDYPLHAGMSKMVKEINYLYRHSPALWENDFDWQGFAWIDFGDAEQSVISYLRKDASQTLACVHHFTPELRKSYSIRLAGVKRIREIFSSDALEYGGTGLQNREIRLSSHDFTIDLPPLATLFFEVEFT